MFQNDCDLIARGSRRVRDTRDDFAIILQGILSHKIFEHDFEHVQNFRDYFAPLGDTCEETGDCFKTVLRPTRDVCGQLSQNSRSPVR